MRKDLRSQLALATDSILIFWTLLIQVDRYLVERSMVWDQLEGGQGVEEEERREGHEKGGHLTFIAWHTAALHPSSVGSMPKDCAQFLDLWPLFLCALSFG